LRFTSSPLRVQFLASISLKSEMHRLCFYAVIMVVAACSTDHHGGFRVGLVTPGSVTDAAWNSGAYAGLQKIHDSLGIPISHIEARSPAEQSEALRSYAAQGYALVFAHGFAVAFDGIQIPSGHDVVLVAPKAQGHFVRSEFVAGRGVPCMLGIGADASGKAQYKALSYAGRIGCLRSGAIATTFREEAITDLFGEQAVLCGGVPELIKAAFDTLVARGYAPEVAYIECLQELKIIADLMYDGGLHYMRTHISRTAAWGSFTSGERLITGETRRALASMLDDIESGKFARQWIEEARAGQTHLDARISEESLHEIESAGREARSLMNSPTERKKT